MPIKNHELLVNPESDYQIVKYLDLTKYVSLLQKQALYFCRLDKLEDPFEGLSLKANLEYRISWWKKTFPNLNLSEDEIRKQVFINYNEEEELKKDFYVDCWNKDKNESAALWKIYSSFTQGIMIKSSINKLREALNENPITIRLSEVKYFNRSKETIEAEGSGQNLYHTAILKSHSYKFENEVRLIIDKRNKNQVDNYIATNLKTLINEVKVSPNCEDWFLELVQNLTTTYGLDNIIVRKSEFNNK